VFLQPRGKRVRVPVPEKIDDTSPLEIDEPRAVALPFASRPLIHAERTDRPIMDRGRCTPQVAKKRVSRARKAKISREPSAGPTAQREREQAKGVHAPMRSPRVGRGGSGQPLGEDSASAIVGGVEKPSRADAEPDRHDGPGQIEEGADITAVHLRRSKAAIRTSSSRADRNRMDRDASGIDGQRLKAQFVGCRTEGQGSKSSSPARNYTRQVNDYPEPSPKVRHSPFSIAIDTVGRPVGS